MFKERKIPSWVLNGACMILGGSVVIAGERLNVDDVVFNAFGQNQSHSERPLVIELKSDLLLNLPLTEQPPQQEILDYIKHSLVTVIRSTKPGYEPHVPSTFKCQGFITRNLQNEPIVITALHCIPSTIVSKVDGNTYATRAKDGSIFDVQILDFNGETYNSKGWLYYNDPLNQIENDVIMVRLFEQDRITVPGLSLNIAELKRGGVYYMMTRSDEDVMQVSTIHFLDSLQGIVRFIDLSNKDTSCVPGTSGSAVVNSAGEIISIISSTSNFVLTGGVIEEFNLNRIHLGRVVRVCYGISSSRILGLTSEKFPGN